MEGYARIVTGTAMLAEGLELPAGLRAFVDEVRSRDAQAIADRRQGFAFLRKAEMHCRNWPLLKWAAAKRGRPLGELPEHAAWLAEGAALAGTGRRIETGSGAGIAAGIGAALRRLVRSRDLDEAARFREARTRHEAEAQAAGLALREMTGAASLAQWARSLRGPEVPEALRPTVEAWCAVDAEREPGPEMRQREQAPNPDNGEAARRIEAFLLDCDGLLFEAGNAGMALSVGVTEPDPWAARAGTLRQQGLRMLGEGPGARLDDPARIRLARVEPDRARVREAVDTLAKAARQRRSERFMALGRIVRQLCRKTGTDPVDAEEWPALRTRAEELRGEPGLSPAVERAVRWVFARNARAKDDTRPVAEFLQAGELHMQKRTELEEEARKRGVAPAALEETTAWRERSDRLPETGERLLAGAGDGPAEARAAARLERMPRLRAEVRDVLDSLEAAWLRDHMDAFRAAARTVEARARQADTLPRHAEGYGRAMALAELLADRKTLPDDLRQEVRNWLDRDRDWQEELAEAARLTGAPGRRADPGAKREASAWPAVAEAIRRETDRLARLPEPGRYLRWTDDVPLVPGDRLRLGSGNSIEELVVVSAGEAGGTRETDRLELQILFPTGPASPPDKGPVVLYVARHMIGSGCARAVWSDEGLRDLELARQHSVPSAFCRLPCSEPVPGDRIAWTEADVTRDRVVRTIEAVVTARPGTILYRGGRLQLRVLDASGPDAPDTGSTIDRTVDAVTARGCFRAEWTDEARRERILNPPEPPRQQVVQRTQKQSQRHEGGGRSM